MSDFSFIDKPESGHRARGRTDDHEFEYVFNEHTELMCRPNVYTIGTEKLDGSLFKDPVITFLPENEYNKLNPWKEEDGSGSFVESKADEFRTIYYYDEKGPLRESMLYGKWSSDIRFRIKDSKKYPGKCYIEMIWGSDRENDNRKTQVKFEELLKDTPINIQECLVLRIKESEERYSKIAFFDLCERKSLVIDFHDLTIEKINHASTWESDLYYALMELNPPELTFD